MTDKRKHYVDNDKFFVEMKNGNKELLMLVKLMKLIHQLLNIWVSVS